MKLVKLLCFSFLLLVTNCSVTNSESESSKVHGQVFDQDGNPIEDVSIGIIYTFTQGKAATDFNVYPNPFSGSTRINFDLETETNFKLTGENLRTSNINIIIDNTLQSGHHTVEFPTSNVLNIGFFKISDNLGNETIAFHAPEFPIKTSNTENTMMVEGNIVGDVYTSTNRQGKFSFNSNKILNKTVSFPLMTQDAVELGRHSLNDNVYIVAFINDDIYETKLVNTDDITDDFTFQLSTQ